MSNFDLSKHIANLTGGPSEVIDITEICEILGIHRSTLHRRIERGSFPKACWCHPSGRTIGWLVTTFEEWKRRQSAI